MRPAISTPPSTAVEAMTLAERLMFVGGPPRAGTTLVQNILDTHPRICGGPELLHLVDILDLRKKLRGSIDGGWIAQFCDYSRADDLIRSLIENLIRPVWDRYGGDYYSEKTPSDVLIFSDLVELYPKARFIFVVRDPRAVVSSLLQVGRKGAEAGRQMQRYTRSQRAAISYVRQCLEAGFRAMQETPRSVLLLKYESLVRNPEQEARRICDFLGLEWYDQMAQPASVEHPGESALAEGVWYDEESFRRDPVPKEIDKWKTLLNARQQVAISRAFEGNPELKRLGYDFSLPHFSPARRQSAIFVNELAALANRLVVSAKGLVKYLEGKGYRALKGHH